ncbi:uncharacterized protein LOC119721323 isoform X2 [Patiria miniata]|uniref:Uncharacterized protein n=1 Tax=Patiria miniata TaxID=46514 RepID=A0A913Z8E3_PATMI|nr:uncharacterized protein LOC119721323 isoform X2 [Patiria miniata]
MMRNAVLFRYRPSGVSCRQNTLHRLGKHITICSEVDRISESAIMKQSTLRFMLVVAVCVAVGGMYTAWKSVEKAGQTRQEFLRTQKRAAMKIGYLLLNKTRNMTRAHDKKVLIDVDKGKPDFDNLFKHLVVVTAFSENHYKEAMGMIGSAQKAMPQTRIVVFDIGMKNKTLQKIKTLCNVEVRKFQFQKYPAYVSNLATYAWKVIIIKEALNEFGAIFWSDASVRFVKSLRLLVPFACEHHGYLSRIHSYNASTTKPIKHNYYMTVDQMYKAIGVDRKDYFSSPYAPHPASNRQLVLNSTTVQRNYLQPLYACATDKNCISPPGAKHGHNHRFDASALMLVIHKYFPGEYSRENDHVKDFDDVMYMHRVSNDWNKAKFCTDSVQI